MNAKELATWNRDLRDRSPEEICKWALNRAKKPVVTTSFGKHSASILHLVTRLDQKIPVIWCDTGYNTTHTYRHAVRLIKSMELNIEIYVPRLSAGFRDVTLGIPAVDHPDHERFTEEVKLEPFRRAMEEQQPDFWFTNLRKGQTEYRDTLDILTMDKRGVIKVCPFFYSSDEEVESYLNSHELPDESRYFDPTKQLEHRECGIHLGK